MWPIWQMLSSSTAACMSQENERMSLAISIRRLRTGLGRKYHEVVTGIDERGNVILVNFDQFDGLEGQIERAFEDFSLVLTRHRTS